MTTANDTINVTSIVFPLVMVLPLPFIQPSCHRERKKSKKFSEVEFKGC